MNWLERARREISECAPRLTAITAERNPTAAMAVHHSAFRKDLAASIDSIGSNPPLPMPRNESAWEAFEERAAIMEFDGGLSRDEAEREAWIQVSNRERLH